jgi:D-alanyl-D-alanine carboxypeptidase
MKRWASIIAPAFVFGVLSGGRAAPAVADTNRVFTPAMSAQVDALALDELHAGRTPGLAIGIVEDGRLVYARGFGFAILANHVPMTPDTEFYVGGITMQFTAAAVLLLVQDGKLKLDDKVSKYLPNFHSADDITVAQLLTQTSGLPDYTQTPNGSLDFTHSIKINDLFAAVDQMKAAAPPGAVYANNPLNYLTAAAIVEKVSGVSFSDYLQQHIFLPLVMNHTFLAGDSGIAPTAAVGYTRAGRGFATGQPWDPAWLGGALGLVTTVDDLAKWDTEMPILLRVDAVRTMFTPSARLGPTQYGMGWVVDRRGGKDLYWYNGDVIGYRAMNALLPTEHVAVIVLSNVDARNGGPVVVPEELTQRVLDIVLPPAAAQLDNAVLARAKEWLERLATRQVDRSELTPAFSAYLTDDVVERANFAALGTLQAIVPISSSVESNGDTVYVFLVQYPHAQYHYRFGVTSAGKIDEISLIS